ncbi:MAG TPA: DUF4278 domain-containing protein [Xenococcaceae cyanobacterium]
MKLRFLGQTYSTSFSQIDTEMSQQTGHFLGQKYYLRRPVKTDKSQLGLRKYRGIPYGV